MTSLVEMPITTKVSVNIQGTPLNIYVNGMIERITKIYQNWISSDREISGNVKKKYYTVRTNQSKVYDIYHESTSDMWFLDKIHQ
jgi:hypothetical protein